MKQSLITCEICGTQYSATEQQACQSCPVHSSCQTTCCPHCGYQQINIESSRMANWLSRWFKSNKSGDLNEIPF